MAVGPGVGVASVPTLVGVVQPAHEHVWTIVAVEHEYTGSVMELCCPECGAVDFR